MVFQCQQIKREICGKCERELKKLCIIITEETLHVRDEVTVNSMLVLYDGQALQRQN